MRELALQAVADTRFVPAAGENRLRSMTETRPDWVISRQRAWGVPITVFLNEKTGEVIPNDNSTRQRADRPHLRRLRGRRRGRVVQRRRRVTRAFPRRARRRSVRMEEGRRHSRRLVRVRLDPCLRAGEAQGSRLARGALPRRLRPASRLVRLLADGSLRHARPGAVRRDPDARLRPRREGRREDVEVEGQHALAAGRRQAERRRNPAPVGGGLGLFRRHPLRSRHRPVERRILPQAAQHDALPARQSRRITARAARRLRRHARAGALHPAPALGARRAGAQGLRQFRLQARVLVAVQLLHRRPLLALFRHPQGRALLRAAFQPEAPRRPDAARRAVRLPDHLARPDPLLHLGGSLSGALPVGEGFGACEDLPGYPRRNGATKRSPRNGTRSGRSARS